MRRAAILATAVLLPALASAHEPTTISVRTYNVVTLFSPPPWASAETVASASEIFRDEGETPNGTKRFILEFVPKGQSFEGWVELYALTAETPLEGDVADSTSTC